MTSLPLTDAEQAAAEALARFSGDLVLAHSREARAVVAAVRSLVEADALDALADAAAKNGPITVDHLRVLGFVVRKQCSTVRDWLTDDTTEPLSRSISGETRDDDNVSEHKGENR